MPSPGPYALAERGDDFVFSTGTGRPLGQRNVARAPRLAQTKAEDESGNPTFPVLHQRDLALTILTAITSPLGP